MSPDDRTEQLLSHACEIGFDPVGVCRAESAATYPAFVSWLDETMRNDACEGMRYLVRHCEARQHPAAVLPEVKSLVVVGLSYAAVNPKSAQPAVPPPHGFGLVAEYARGIDYHDALRVKLRQLAATHRRLFPNAKTRIAVDTAPLLEREYAVRAGLGLPGKNTMLMNDKLGSRFFLGVILSTAELRETVDETAFSTPAMFNSPECHSLCDTCQLCVEACPTGALATPYRLDARVCINYWSIEYQGNNIPYEIASKFGNRLYGCDTCQCVCPYNGRSAMSSPANLPLDRLTSRSLREQLETGMMSLSLIESLDESEFQNQFTGTSLMRLGLVRLKRNAAIVREQEERY